MILALFLLPFVQVAALTPSPSHTSLQRREPFIQSWIDWWYTPVVIPVGQYAKPSSTNMRSPCPGLNTLANHGYLNREGRNISVEAISAAFQHVYGLSESTSAHLIKFAQPFMDKNVYGLLDLDSLVQHNLLEHDASLVHVDFKEGVPVQLKADTDMLEEFLPTSHNGQVITISEIGAWRKKVHE
jgi:Peroxidase, family 2